MKLNHYIQIKIVNFTEVHFSHETNHKLFLLNLRFIEIFYPLSNWWFKHVILPRVMRDVNRRLDNGTYFEVTE